MGLGLLIAIMVYLAVPVGLWLGLRTRLRRHAGQIEDSGAACGACGYGLRGVASFECPECGADLREAGMVPPKDQIQSREVYQRFIWIVLAWTVGYALALTLAIA